MKSCLDCFWFESSICAFCESPAYNFYEPPMITIVNVSEPLYNDLPF